MAEIFLSAVVVVLSAVCLRLWDRARHAERRMLEMAADARARAGCGAMTTDEVVEEIMHACAEHGYVSAECAEDHSHPCVIVWSEHATEHISAMVDAWCRGGMTYERKIFDACHDGAVR